MTIRNMCKYKTLDSIFKQSKRKEYEWAILLKKVDSPFLENPPEIFNDLKSLHCWDSPTELIKYCCALFTKEVINPKVNTIWKGFKSDPSIRLGKRGIKKLGKRQRAFLLYVFRRFFRYGRPVFECQANIARAIGCSREQVNVIISQLVSLGYLIKIHWPTETGKKHFILVPSDPIISSNLSERYTQERSEILASYASQFPDQDEENLTPEGYILSYIFSTYQNQKNITYSLGSEKPTAPVDLVSVSLANGKDSFMKKNLKQKQQPLKKHLNTKPAPLVRKKLKCLDTNDIGKHSALNLATRYLNSEDISKKQLNALFSALSAHFEIPADKLFANMSDKQIFGVTESKLFDMLLNLYCRDDNPKLQWSFAERAIGRFNRCAKDVDQMMGTRINPESLVYIKTVIATTYRLYVDLGLKQKPLLDGINTLSELIDYDNSIKYYKSLNLLTFLVNPRCKGKWINYLTMSKDEVNIQLRQRSPSFPLNCSLWKNLYAARFDDLEEGYKYFDMGQSRMTRFMDELCAKVIKYNLNLDGLKLLAPTKCEETGIMHSPALETYLEFLAERYRDDSHARTIKIITDYDNWEDFVFRMRNDSCHTKFWTVNREQK